MGKHLEQALPSVYTFQCLTGKVDNNNNNNNYRKSVSELDNCQLPQEWGQEAMSNPHLGCVCVWGGGHEIDKCITMSHSSYFHGLKSKLIIHVEYSLKCCIN